MLVLGRKVDEQVIIQDAIGHELCRITLVQVRSQEYGGVMVRLGFDAPRNIVVLRGEVAERMHCNSIAPKVR